MSARAKYFYTIGNVSHFPIKHYQEEDVYNPWGFIVRGVLILLVFDFQVQSDSDPEIFFQ